MKHARPGFTLIEVMIAVAILALGLSTVFGSSVIAARGTAHARMITQAALLARCRMTEVESYLRQNQLPETEQTLEDPPDSNHERCCEGAFSCAVRVDRIELPPATQVSTAVGDRLLGRATSSARGTTYSSLGAPGASRGDGGISLTPRGSGDSSGSSGPAGGGLMGLASAFSALGAGGGSDPTGGLASALAGGLGGGGGGGAGRGGGGLAGAGAPSLQSMTMELIAGVYPTLKPLLEGAIRMVTVTVSWHEGEREYHFDVVQYVTNPGQTIATGEALNALEGRNPTTGAGGPGAPPGQTPPGQTVPGQTPSTTPPGQGTTR